MNEDDYSFEDDKDIRRCSYTCSHFDGLNQCCWLASRRGLCSDVAEDDVCLYGFYEL